jgi:hypothetical protein
LRSGITDNVVTQLWAIKVLGALNNGCASQPKLLVYKTEASAQCSLCLCGEVIDGNTHRRDAEDTELAQRRSSKLRHTDYGIVFTLRGARGTLNCERTGGT